MKVIIVEPFKAPYAGEIAGDLKSMQDTVGGYIETISPFNDEKIILVCNEQGMLENLRLNRLIHNATTGWSNWIRGTFFLCYSDGADGMISFPDELIYTYTEKLKGVVASV